MDIQDQYKNQYLVYNRKSTDDADNQKNSLAYQRSRVNDYALREQLSIAKTLTVPDFCINGIIDESHSAFKEEDEFVFGEDGSVQYRILRPKFRKLIELLSARKIKGVIFLCWDRASRNEQDSTVLKKLIAQGCDIRFVDTKYEKNSSGKLHMSIDGMFANHYSNTISEKVKHAYKKLHAEGKCTYSAPIGYLDEGSANKPLDPERAPIVKRVFELYATGEWSFTQLAKWANEQGLTQKPMRRKRTKQEIANNVSPESIPKIMRAVTHKTIEYMLPNPFYIGKLKVDNQFIESKAHQPLIDTQLFNKVQGVLQQRAVSVHYVDKDFQTYRGLLRCTCGRAYSPYEQKGITYYRSRCKEGCDNKHPNISEAEVNSIVQGALSNLHFTDEELLEIEAHSKDQLSVVSERRNKKLADLHAKQRNILADVDYLTQNKVTLLRTGSMTPEDIRSEQGRLEQKLSLVHEEIRIYGESAQDTLNYYLRFSELVKNASLYFEYALDNERHEIVTQMFTELVIKNKTLAKYDAKDGFDDILSRIRLTGSADRIRTCDLPVTPISEFPQRVDYIITHHTGWGARRFPEHMFQYSLRIVSEPSPKGLAADCPRLYVRVSSNSPRFQSTFL